MFMFIYVASSDSIMFDFIDSDTATLLSSAISVETLAVRNISSNSTNCPIKFKLGEMMGLRDLT
ncbi:hypothetical protein DERF_001857 [Dermatophagoides farinae]|uniref:Uncharacterized protein n=1 Tax=Dermatophagoides farinae TaxID=6954 RepID=A0A922IAB5_DERFA|nr:hypothetical protein DERF_001857 [Dermatophagoides farinae]